MRVVLCVAIAFFVGAVAWTLRAAIPLWVNKGSDTITISERVLGVKSGLTYAYILHEQNQVVLIDTGSDPTAAALHDALKGLGLDTTSVRAILLTHGHFDHSAAIQEFPNAALYMNRVDLPLLRGDEGPKAPLMRLRSRLVKHPWQPEVVHSLDPASELSLLQTPVHIIPLPGHTAGSVAFLYDDVLFVGDALWLTDHTLEVPSFLFSDNSALTVLTAPRLAPKQFRAIADGHRGYAADGRIRYENFVTTMKLDVQPLLRE